MDGLGGGPPVILLVDQGEDLAEAVDWKDWLLSMVMLHFVAGFLMAAVVSVAWWVWEHFGEYLLPRWEVVFSYLKAGGMPTNPELDVTLEWVERAGEDGVLKGGDDRAG